MAWDTSRDFVSVVTDALQRGLSDDGHNRLTSAIPFLLALFKLVFFIVGLCTNSAFRLTIFSSTSFLGGLAAENEDPS